MGEQAEMLENLDPKVPFVADADADYGGLNMVVRTAANYHRVSVAALHIED
jgi:2-methylisocitrate lyase-like PEP mutase family enzyme